MEKRGALHLVFHGFAGPRALIIDALHHELVEVLNDVLDLIL